MGNIKHNDELLRVHDDGFDVVFNCDNKHQNGVSYHAEKNGKKTKIDPEYAAASLVKKIGQGGWPSDLPKPSVGGYGYTEQGEQTVIVDNERVTTVAHGNGMIYGQFATPFDIFDDAYTVIFNGTEYNLNSTFEERIEGYYLGESTESGYDFSRYPFVIVNFGLGGPALFTESAGDYEVTVKKSSDTIHKIDEKYLPASGGVMVVTITANSDYTITASHTPNQVKTAMLAGTPVVGIFTNNADGGGEVIPLGSAVWNHFIEEEHQLYDAGPAFAIYTPQPGLMFVKNWNQDKWEFTWWFENDD